MSLKSLLTETVDLIYQVDGALDDYNTPTDNYTGTPVTTKARIEPVEERELTAGRDTRISEFRMFLLPNVTVDALSRVRDSANKIYEVIGAPGVYRTPRGAHHQELRLRFIEG